MKKLITILTLLTTSLFSNADISISKSKNLDSTTELLNDRYELTCQAEGGFITDRSTDQFFEIGSIDACAQIIVYSRLSSEKCKTRIHTSPGYVLRVSLNCPIEVMISQ